MSDSEYIEIDSNKNEIRIDRIVLVVTYAATFGFFAYIISHFVFGV